MLEPEELRPLIAKRCARSRERARGLAAARARLVPASAQGQRQRKGRPVVRARLHLEAAAVRLGDRARDEQAEAALGTPCPLVARPNFSKISPCSSAGMPGPRSVTATCTCPFDAVARTSTLSPAGEYLTAFSTRFASTCRSRPGSRPETVGRSSEICARSSTSSWPISACGDDLAHELADLDFLEGVGERSCPRSLTCRARRRSARRGATSRPRSAPGTTRAARETARANAWSVRAEPITVAIGPWSSCETSETKSARRADSRRS